MRGEVDALVQGCVVRNLVVVRVARIWLVPTLLIRIDSIAKHVPKLILHFPYESTFLGSSVARLNSDEILLMFDECLFSHLLW